MNSSQKRKIVQLGNPVLRKQAELVTDFESEYVKQVVADMQFTLAQSNGVGIAAPQVSESKAIVIIASRPTARYPSAPEMEPVVLFNPTMTVVNPVLEKDWEGCLSIPGIRALVPRFKAIQVDFQNAEGTKCVLALEEFPARVFQHEYDHLQGLVYLDRVENNREIISEAEFLKNIEI